MALSNIFNEPQREITETAIGLTVAAVFVGGMTFLNIHLYNSGLRLWSTCQNDSIYLTVALAFLPEVMLLMLGFAVISVIAVIIHTLGERLCNSLDRVGLSLRPKQRHKKG